ncbi:hypothetical protein RB601_002192 [Gaeumannomyces tritici]
MRFSPTHFILTALLLSHGGSGAPAEPPSGESFSLMQVRNENYVPSDGQNSSCGLEAMLRAYAKYHVPLTAELSTAIRLNVGLAGAVNKRAGTATGTVAASPPPIGYDLEYITPVKIGTPPQTINVVLDTGSADFWVMSSDTPSKQRTTHAIYRPGRSSTARRVSRTTWNIGYGDGSGAGGIVYRDKVSLGRASFARQTVQGAQWVSDMFTRDVHISGIMGMGMSSGSTVRPSPAKTFMDNMRPSLRQPLFTANLKKGKAGNFNFGYVNRAEYTGGIAYSAASRSSIYWEITVDGYQLAPDAYQRRPWRAIVDTGTTLLLLPDAMVRAYYAKVPGTRYDAGYAAFVFPCNARLPDFRFGIGGYRGLVPGRYINYGYINPTTCYGGIQSSEGIGISILGDILLKAQFVVFDLGRMRVGFANKKLET